MTMSSSIDATSYRHAARRRRAPSAASARTTAAGAAHAARGRCRDDTLRDAYRHGIFPWPHERLPLPWFSPRRRTVLFFDELHVGRTLRRSMTTSSYEFTIDRA